MLKWMFPLVVLTACVSSNPEPFEEQGEIREYQPKLIVPKEPSVESMRRLKSVCLPDVNDEFAALKLLNGKGVGVYEYLILQIDSLAERTILETDSFWGPTKWEQQFKNGVLYKSFIDVEVGFGGELYSKCRDKDAFFSVISKVIERSSPKLSEWGSEYVWKNDSTLYEPKTELEGCHYYIKMDEKGYYLLTWTCAC